MDNFISANIEDVRRRIASAALRGGRRADEITLCVVTKTQPIASVLSVVQSGNLDLGENYYQELRGKWDQVPSNVRWHFIGGLQSNKAKYLAGRCETIQSVDNLALATEINRRANHAELQQGVLIEVQLGGGEGRAGVNLNSAEHLSEQIMELPNLQLKGLMAVAPFGVETPALRQAFRQLRTLFDKLPAQNRTILSMGMTGDFETAIEEGSTFVRIGTAIFGPRTTHVK